MPGRSCAPSLTTPRIRDRSSSDVCARLSVFTADIPNRTRLIVHRSRVLRRADVHSARTARPRDHTPATALRTSRALQTHRDNPGSSCLARALLTRAHCEAPRGCEPLHPTRVWPPDVTDLFLRA